MLPRQSFENFVSRGVMDLVSFGEIQVHLVGAFEALSVAVFFRIQNIIKFLFTVFIASKASFLPATFANLFKPL